MSMAMEGRRCKVNRRDWPAFLNRLVPHDIWQSLARDCITSRDPRVRWSPKFVVLAYIAMGWAAQRTLAGRFEAARQWVADLHRARRRPGHTYVGLTKAADRYGAALFQTFWRDVRRTFAARLKQTWCEHGWVVFAADGSRIDAPRTRANEKALGCAGRDKSHPQWWMTWIVHLPTLLLWDWRQGPGTASERDHLRQMQPTLPPRALILADCGFGGFDFLSDLDQAGVAFLVRCGGNTTFKTELTDAQIERRANVGDVFLWPGNRRGQRPLRLRLIVLKRGGRRIYLVTNVFDRAALSRSMAGAFYRQRWGVEVNYRDFKCTMERSKVLAHTSQRGALELAGNIVAMGLLRLHAVMVQYAKGARISVARVLQLLRKAMEHLRYAVSTRWFVSAMKRAITDDYHRKRPKASRDWPRKNQTTAPSAPRFHRPNRREWAKLQRAFRHRDAALG